MNTTDEIPKFRVSTLKHHYRNGYLVQDRISECLTGDTFATAHRMIMGTAFKTVVDDKKKLNSWSPCVYMDTHPVYGYFVRNADSAEDDITVIVFDIDNKTGTPIRYDDAIAVLDNLGVNFFSHTTFSHTAQKHCFRIIVEPSRNLTWEENAKIAAVLNGPVFNNQVDMSVNQKGRHFYGPAAVHRHDHQIGERPLDVDGFLSLYDDLPEGQRIVKPFEAYVPVYIPPIDPNRSTPRPNVITIGDNRLCSPQKLEQYDALYIGGSHHQSMYGTLKHVFNRARRNNIALEHSDMVTVFNELDARHGNYVSRNYGKEIIQQEIKKIMKG
jgi:hypothetical protein